ncbi:MAG TPA: SCP2 sterol-binding domain-containing protein [Solirubrobacteraceae bacterium]|jgi:hypothetical protein|nr:SCP2 sterol-binding domain-containing protein [Solirubrobacteraceae bacterium]
MRLPKTRWPGDLQWLARRTLREIVRHTGDADLEKRVGTQVMLRLIFATIASSYDPSAGDGFQGLISFELTRPASGRPASWWMVSVGSDGVAESRPGRPDPGSAQLQVRLPVGDLLRIASGVIDPVEPVLAGRALVSGELAVAARLGEMFGAPQVR